VAGLPATGGSSTRQWAVPVHRLFRRKPPALGDAAVVAIELVDGTGKRHKFTRSDDDDNEFFAAGVSMGLLGVITGHVPVRAYLQYWRPGDHYLLQGLLL
jgi:hypothetical protein